jgi:hypothetical protein
MNSSVRHSRSGSNLRQAVTQHNVKVNLSPRLIQHCATKACEHIDAILVSEPHTSKRHIRASLPHRWGKFSKMHIAKEAGVKSVSQEEEWRGGIAPRVLNIDAE